MRRGASVAAVLLVLSLVAGCGGGYPTETQEVRYSDAQASYRLTTETSDAILSHAREVFPELTFDLNYDASRDDTWGDCSEVPGNANPTHVVWNSNRNVTIEPRQPTVELVTPIMQAFIDDGWEVSGGDLGRGMGFYRFSKDGFGIGFWTADEEWIEEGYVARLYFGTGSPCLEAPDDLADFDPDNPDAYFGPGSAPTVGPFTPPPTLPPVWQQSS